MKKLIAINGSPRRSENTAQLLQHRQRTGQIKGEIPFHELKV